MTTLLILVALAFISLMKKESPLLLIARSAVIVDACLRQAVVSGALGFNHFRTQISWTRRDLALREIPQGKPVELVADCEVAPC